MEMAQSLPISWNGSNGKTDEELLSLLYSKCISCCIAHFSKKCSRPVQFCLFNLATV